MTQDGEQAAFLRKYLDGLGISEEEYWNTDVSEAYKKVLTVRKLYNSEKKKFTEENSAVTDPNALNSKFEDYWDSYRKSLLDKANIQSDLNPQ